MKRLPSTSRFDTILAVGRLRRLTAGGVVYHVLNRANRRAKIFRKHRDYQAFVEIVAQGLERTPCPVLGLCLMPNHWHLVLRPHADGDLSHFMAWHLRLWSSLIAGEASYLIYQICYEKCL
ncbi:MAG TPA: transposase [Tepidisphaeraceae bacterium]|jgi:putative transposase|nr:transposase [Tepidisphaeraceae bacterium]